MPNATTFLTLIGRKLSQHAPKFPDWNSLFTLSSSQLRALGIEPARDRRYLLHWREKFRNGEFGIGGDLKNVLVEGEAGAEVVTGKVKVVDVELSTGQGRSRRRVVEVGNETRGTDGDEPMGLRVKARDVVVGKGVKHVKGSHGQVGVVRVEEGLWEMRRGHTVDGGERRKAEVRAKRRAEEKKNR